MKQIALFLLSATFLFAEQGAPATEEQKAISDELWLECFTPPEAAQNWTGSIAAADQKFTMKMTGEFKGKEDGWVHHTIESEDGPMAGQTIHVWSKITKTGLLTKESAKSEGKLSAPRPLILGKSWTNNDGETFVATKADFKGPNGIVKDCILVTSESDLGGGKAVSKMWFAPKQGNISFSMSSPVMTMEINKIAE